MRIVLLVFFFIPSISFAIEFNNNFVIDCNDYSTGYYIGCNGDSFWPNYNFDAPIEILGDVTFSVSARTDLINKTTKLLNIQYGNNGYILGVFEYDQTPNAIEIKEFLITNDIAISQLKLNGIYPNMEFGIGSGTNTWDIVELRNFPGVIAAGSIYFEYQYLELPPPVYPPGNNYPIPEPSTFFLLTAGIAGLTWHMRKRQGFGSN